MIEEKVIKYLSDLGIPTLRKNQSINKMNTL